MIPLSQIPKELTEWIAHIIERKPEEVQNMEPLELKTLIEAHKSRAEEALAKTDADLFLLQRKLARMESLRSAMATLTERRIEGALCLRDWIINEWPLESQRPVLRQYRVTVWDPNIFAAAIRGSESFIGQRYQDMRLTIEPQFWLNPWGKLDDWSSSIGDLVGMDYEAETKCIVAMGISLEPNNPLPIVKVYYADREFAPTCTYLPVKECVDPVMAEVLARLRFMEMEWVGLERQVLPRHLRRAAELGRRPPLPEINIVRLRRSYHEHRPGDSDAREYSCSWMVTGHWRKPSPLYSRQEPVWVKPYVKGDTDKPLRVPKGTVHLVNR